MSRTRDFIPNHIQIHELPRWYRLNELPDRMLSDEDYDWFHGYSRRFNRVMWAITIALMVGGPAVLIWLTR